jgi:hypothetical protein
MMVVKVIKRIVVILVSFDPFYGSELVGEEAEFS